MFIQPSYLLQRKIPQLYGVPGNVPQAPDALLDDVDALAVEDALLEGHEAVVLHHVAGLGRRAAGDVGQGPGGLEAQVLVLRGLENLDLQLTLEYKHKLAILVINVLVTGRFSLRKKIETISSRF